MVPQVYDKIGEEILEEWFSSAKILFLIFNWSNRDINFTNQAQEDEEQNPIEENIEIETLRYLIEELRSSKFVVVTRKAQLEDICLGLQESEIDLICLKIEKLLPPRKEILGDIEMNSLLYSSDSEAVFTESCRRLASSNPKMSSSDLVWEFIQQRLKKFSVSFALPETIQDELLLILSRLAFSSLSLKKCGATLIHMSNDKRKLFDEFLHQMLLSRPKVCPDTGQEYFFHHQQQKFCLAAFFVFRQESLSALSKIRERESVAIQVAGHLYRQVKANLFALDDPIQRRILKNLFLLSEDSEDPTSYLLKILNALHCHNQLTETFLREAVFPRQLEISDEGILLEPLMKLMEIADPRRVLFIIKSTETAFCMPKILHFLSIKPVSVGLALMCHLKFESPVYSDELLEVFTKQNSIARLQDFLGSLSLEGIRFLNTASLNSLVCLRVKIDSEKAASELFSVHLKLPNLLWFEVDFDFPVLSVPNLNLPTVISPLCDISLSGIGGTDVSRLIEFLLSFQRDYFSGLHLHRSHLSPNAVSYLLEQLRKHKIKLTTPRDVIARYRRWRFPELAVLSNEELKEEEKVRHLLGYDDRHQYGDNEVRGVGVFNDTEQLEEILAQDEELVYFVYEAANVEVEKKADGSISCKRFKNLQ